MLTGICTSAVDCMSVQHSEVLRKRGESTAIFSAEETLAGLLVSPITR